MVLRAEALIAVAGCSAWMRAECAFDSASIMFNDAYSGESRDEDESEEGTLVLLRKHPLFSIKEKREWRLRLFALDVGVEQQSAFFVCTSSRARCPFLKVVFGEPHHRASVRIFVRMWTRCASGSF